MVSAVDQQGETSAGVILPAGSGSWEILSSRDAKDQLEVARTDEVLASLLELPLYTWSYRADPYDALHIGPIAEDFHTSFTYGTGSSTIASVDADGIALAAIQELGKLVRIQDERLSAQEQRLDGLERELESVRNSSIRLQVLNWTLIFLVVMLIARATFNSHTPPSRG
jgi:hypothetical protein